MIPLWRGSYERSTGFHPFESEWPIYREHAMQWVSEVRQSVDYLEMREDVDASKIGLQGISFGTVFAPLLMAMEPRIRCGLLLVGGLLSYELHTTPMPAEIDSLNYLAGERAGADAVRASRRDLPLRDVPAPPLPAARHAARAQAARDVPERTFVRRLGGRAGQADARLAGSVLRTADARPVAVAAPRRIRRTSRATGLIGARRSFGTGVKLRRRQAENGVRMRRA